MTSAPTTAAVCLSRFASARRTAFRDTLGNGIYADPADAGELSAEALRQFFYSHAVPSRLAVVGTFRRWLL